MKPLKVVAQDVRSHFESTASTGLLLKLLLCLGGLFWINYFTSFPLLNLAASSPLASSLLFYSIAVVVAILITAKDVEELRRIDNSEIIYLISTVLVLGAIQGWFLPSAIMELIPEEAAVFAQALYYNLKSAALYLLLPLIGVFLLNNIPETGTSRLKEPYRTAMGKIFLIMIPIIIVASTSEAFQQAYPRYRPGLMESTGLMSSFVSVFLYESSYLMQFFSLEIFFRGFLIFAFSQMFGTRSVWFMVVIYGMLHFTKPMAEALGSLIGGYVLGVISLRSHSVYGGFLIHGGVALLMEICAFFWLYN